ncbi:L,D-transpeptidase family protein [Hoeflea prorocentri]|uniref:L,D-transpeptidase family protein n=1 Tax=Hoeflea prorocentri TaxID=1922333 RepID=A0A9X3ZGY1_9HYPH|nr:L,D-transpeptidase family protein [Hoeflea prorocentri]MCY6380296.1 L,D-transpeptidase family protein [Hoeflea prorocentri]MDA5398096.1 L,D-transpeptidase family protein [Hoeflea prorocentri]
MRKSLVMLACVFGVGAVLPTAPPAFAQSSLFEVIFGQQQRGKRHRQRQIEKFRAQRATKPAPRVKAPSFYNYKPDAVKTVDLSPLAEIEVASAEPMVIPPIPQDEFERSLRHLEGHRIQALKEVGDALIEYYKANHAFVWVTDMKPNARAMAAMEELAAADMYGLSSDDYRVDVPGDDYDPTKTSERLREMIQFEVALSAKALRYVLDATRGRVDPNRLSGYHDFKRKEVDLVSALGNLAATSDAKVYLQGSNPGNDQFEALSAELAELRAADAEDHIEIAEGTFLKPGRSSPELKNIVAAIRKRGSDTLLVDHGITLMEYQADGGDLYTPELVSMVRAFQTESGLKPDGIVGKMTIGKLSGMTNETKIGKVILAMERLRWLPRDLGTRHVFINQPAYEATYMNNGKEGISMRAVVGKKSNQTSFFYDEIETVEYNPYWGVPRSIIVNEMLPKLRRDPSYLDRQGYELTDRRGRRVASRNIDWYSVGSKIPVDVRQPPGKRNALGELKIMFPNKHAIYMHDTPAKKLFSRDARAFSHGCVRLQDPRGMAAAVLGTSRDHIAQQIAKGRNMAEPVPGKIPVYVSYFTAWPGEDGTIGYYADMYDRDKHLNKAIKRTEQTRQAQS